MPKGTYELVVWQPEYDVPILSIEVTAERTVELEATVVPEEDRTPSGRRDPDAIWQA